MALILNVETATSLCSVSLAQNGKVIAERETMEDKSHAARLTVFIEELINEKHIRIGDVDAVAIGKGPGSYTGLRIGVSTAKGLCYGIKKPLIAVGTLDILFRQAILQADLLNDQLNSEMLFCPMIDARRMEVYTCIYSIKGKKIESVAAKIVDQNTFKFYLDNYKMVFFGSGMEKCKDLLTHKNALFIENIYPHSSALAVLSEELYIEKKFENVAYFEPFYLKDFIATVSKKSLHM